MTKVRSIASRIAAYSVHSADRTMFVLRNEMYEYDLDDLAAEIGRSKSCLYAIRSGRTKWPRGDTFFALVKALGLEVVLRRR